MSRINLKNKNKKNALLFSATAITLMSTSALFALPGENNTNTNVLLNNKDKITIEKDSRAISNNPETPDNLTNPSELIYTSQDISGTKNPVWNEVEKTIEQTNLDLWKKLSDSAATLLGESQTKKELMELYDKVKGSADLNKAIADLDKLAIENPVIKEQVEELKQNIIQNSEYELDIKQIQGVENVKQNMFNLSGITKGNSIKSISSHNNSFIKKDILPESTKPLHTRNQSNIGISSIAGSGYVQLIKIAVISPDTTGNYVLQFDYKPNNNSLSSRGFLVIKNDKNQLKTAANVKELQNNLDIFGRYDSNSASNKTDTLENFIFQKNEKTQNYEILVRIKNEESLSNIKFLDKVALPEVDQLVAPNEFGILDVQATDTETFSSIIDNNGKSVETKLVSNINDETNVVKSIQFFSKSLSSTKISNDSGTENILQNRTMTFYQGSGFDFEMPLYFANKNKSIINENDKRLTYSPINIYQNGVDTKNQWNIKLSTIDNNPTIISPKSYDMYSDLRNQLLDLVSGDNFVVASTINLNSKFHSESKIWKQTLSFSDYFYAIGRNDDTRWVSVDTDQTIIPDITIPDITQKIFFEKPKNFNEMTIKEQDSHISAQESVDERSVVVELLGEVYKQFSSQNSGDFNGQTFNIGSVSLWTASESRNSKSKYSNIKTIQKNISGTGNDIYNEINENWTILSGIINSIFGSSTDENRYNALSNSPSSIVSNFFAKTNEFTSNPAEIDKEIANITNIIKSSHPVIDGGLKYESLSMDTKNELAKTLVNLIKIQFGTIFNEFSIRQYEPIYAKLKETFVSEVTGTYNIVKPAEEILELVDAGNANGAKLIKYKSNAWNELSITKEATLSESIKSLYDLLYYGNGDVKLGDSIFNSNEQKNAFTSLNSTDLISFNSDSVFGKRDKVVIYDRALTFFGSSSYSLQSSINKMLSTGNEIGIDFNINDALVEIVNNVVSATPMRETNASISSVNIKTHYLDDVISGTNSIIALNWKLDRIYASNPSNFNNYVVLNSKNKKETNNNDLLVQRINEILKTNPQAETIELSTWSNIINGTYDFSVYSKDLSGRNGNENLNEVFNKLVLDQNILSSRTTLTSPAILAVEKILSIFWWVALALIGVGVLVSSTIGLATKERQVKLSSRPVLKWLLISAIILGLTISALAILFGIVL